MPVAKNWELNKDENLEASRTRLQDAYTPNNPCSARPITKDACKRCAQGICTKGPRHCNYSHDAAKIQDLLDTKQAYLNMVPGAKGACLFFTTGDTCHLRKACPLSHKYPVRRTVEALIARGVKPVVSAPKAMTPQVTATKRGPPPGYEEALLNQPTFHALAIRHSESSGSVSVTIVDTGSSSSTNSSISVSTTIIGQPDAVGSLNSKSASSIATLVNAKSVGEIASPNSKSSALVKVSSTQFTPSKPSPYVSGHSSNGKILTIGNWNTSDDWQSWAIRQLSDETRAKLLAPYFNDLNKGRVPTEARKIFPSYRPVDETSFPQFALLPAELRIKIWGHVLETEPAKLTFVKFQYKFENEHYTLTWFENKGDTPRLLATCRESRYEALHSKFKKYDVIMNTPHRPNSHIHFDLSMDVLLFQTRTSDEFPKMVKHISKEDRFNLRYISMPMRDFLKGNESDVAEATCYFVNLRRIHLILGDGAEDRRVIASMGGLDFHWKMIKGTILMKWRKLHPHRPAPPPEVKLEVISPDSAHRLGIDNLVW